MSVTLKKAAARAREAAEHVAQREPGPLTASAPALSVVPSRPTFLCRLGIHRWKHYTLVLWGAVEIGERRSACARCGKVARP